MLNLLFISDSPKADYIKSVLQPVLKVIIDVVTDFDHGLKDVFEKRPATVCIQDQISGVTGESVARHIQMLLGNSAPSFILLHTGNGKARAIKGLYEHLVDLSQPDEALAEDIKGTLKSLLGDQWGKIYIPPKLTPASIRSSVSVPEESREVAEKLVDDFLFDLESNGFSAIDDQPSGLPAPDSIIEKPAVAVQTEASQHSETEPGSVELDRAQSISDDLAEMLLAEAHKPILNEKRVEPPYSINDSSEVVFNLAPKQVPPAVTPLVPVLPVLPELPTNNVPLKKPEISGPVVSDSTSAAVPVPLHRITRTAHQAAPSATLDKTETPVASSAAEFRISQNTPLAEEHIPEDLLLAFEENYRSGSLFLRRGVAVALVCVSCAAGGWFFVKQKPQVVSSIKQRVISLTGTQSVPVPVVAMPVVPKPLPSAVPQPVVVSTLPAFISKDSHDGSYSVKNPGWERYVGKNAEFRIFNAAGRIQAVQVLAVKNTPIPESLMKTVLQEIAGSPKFKVLSQNMKAGMRVEVGKVQNNGNNGDIMIYRKNGAVKAFVVSIN